MLYERGRRENPPEKPAGTDLQKNSLGPGKIQTLNLGEFSKSPLEEEGRINRELKVRQAEGGHRPRRKRQFPHSFLRKKEVIRIEEGARESPSTRSDCQDP